MMAQRFDFCACLLFAMTLAGCTVETTGEPSRIEVTSRDPLILRVKADGTPGEIVDAGAERSGKFTVAGPCLTVEQDGATYLPVFTFPIEWQANAAGLLGADRTRFELGEWIRMDGAQKADAKLQAAVNRLAQDYRCPSPALLIRSLEPIESKTSTQRAVD